jgi:hypothetical protein
MQISSASAAAGVRACFAKHELDAHSSLVLTLLLEYAIQAVAIACDPNCLILCRSLKKSSLWLPYFAMLAQLQPNSPYFWDDKELAALEGTSVLDVMSEGT